MSTDQSARIAVPMPPNGWNVMQLGQIGWHVRQTAEGWDVSRVFGPECLLQEGDGALASFAPDPVATSDGGRSAADAPNPAAVAHGLRMAAAACDRIAGNTKDFDRDHRRAAGQCAAMIRAEVPPDADTAFREMVAARLIPLVWRGSDPDYTTADDTFGRYEVINTFCVRGFMLHVPGCKSATYHESMEAAQAAASAHRLRTRLAEMGVA